MSAIFNQIQIDGTAYDVRIDYSSLDRNFVIIAGKNARTKKTLTIAYKEIFDPVGTGYEYSFIVNPNPSNLTAYDNFYAKISEAVETHSITMPFGQSTITFNAHIESGKDTFMGYNSQGKGMWGNLVVKFKYVEPVVIPNGN